MRIGVVTVLFVAFACLGVAFSSKEESDKSLRKLYAGAPASWPLPLVDTGVQWVELGRLPEIPAAYRSDSLKALVNLGKILFFDTRLSGSGKISCASCHKPELSWTDGLEKSQGHEGRLNKRNSPSLQNVWFYQRLFWDGRSHSLEDQAFAPINSESEMHQEMQELPFKLRRIQGYRPYFTDAFGDPAIDPERITSALAAFQRSISSPATKFDEFVAGNKNALDKTELRGLHLFRTKARCMNCHHGPLFSDNSFHNNGLSKEDAGRYQWSHEESDKGKLKTPSLRSVMKTAPWMHDGTHHHMDSILIHYSNGPIGADPLLRPLGLNKKERKALLAFLHAISPEPLPFDAPRMPE